MSHESDKRSLAWEHGNLQDPLRLENQQGKNSCHPWQSQSKDFWKNEREPKPTHSLSCAWIQTWQLVSLWPVSVSVSVRERGVEREGERDVHCNVNFCYYFRFTGSPFTPKKQLCLSIQLKMIWVWLTRAVNVGVSDHKLNLGAGVTLFTPL